MELFNHKRVAEGYAKDRPSNHRRIIAKTRKELQLEQSFDRGLDVGCGSGSSTAALKELCHQVIGLEEAPEMLRVAQREHQAPDIRFWQGKAEEAPFPEDFFDIATASGSINWIDPRLFLPSMSRQIKAGGWLIIYDDAISSRSAGDESFAQWYNNEYLAAFPKPFRKEEKWDAELLAPYSFCIVKQEEDAHRVTMNQEEFLRFMITQSNVVSAVERGERSLESVKEWFRQTLERIFRGGGREVGFEGYIWYIQNAKQGRRG